MRIFLLATCFLWLFSPGRASAQASFDCAKADSEVEQLICNDPALAEADASLAQKYDEVRKGYTGDLQAEFVTGQRNWLKLRNKACAIGMEYLQTDEKSKCLEKVYKVRAAELDGQSRLQKAGNMSHLDKALDEKVELASYIPREMSSIYLNLDRFKFDNSHGSTIPETCRELYALQAGAWTYRSDNPGINSEGFAHSECATKIISAQNVAKNAKANENEFRQIEKFSSSFACLVQFGSGDGNPRCDGIKPDAPSFGKLQKSHKLRIVQDSKIGSYSEKGDWIDKYDMSSTLVIGGDNSDFGFDGTDYRLIQIIAGDFTHKGRSEALINLGTSVSQPGHMQAIVPVFAQYDPKRDLIEFRRLEESDTLAEVIATLESLDQ